MPAMRHETVRLVELAELLVDVQFLLGLPTAGTNTVATLGSTASQFEIASAAVSTVIGSPDRVGVTLGALPAALNLAHGVAVLPTGELAIVDTTENAVLVGHF